MAQQIYKIYYKLKKELIGSEQIWGERLTEKAKIIDK